MGVNTTFYFKDDGPDVAHLKFVKDGHKSEPPHLDPLDRPKFEAWCEEQEHVERSNVVCHFQLTSVYEGI